MRNSNSNKPFRPVHEDRVHTKDFSFGYISKPGHKNMKQKSSKLQAGLRNDVKAVPDTGGDSAPVKAIKLMTPTGSTLYILPPVSQVISALQPTSAGLISTQQPVSTGLVSVLQPQHTAPAASHTSTSTSSYLSSTTPSPSSSPAHSAAPPATSSPGKSIANKASSSSSAHQSFHFSSPTVIALMAVGAACTFVGILIVLKVCGKRPKRRIHVVPSNPILQEDYSSDKFSNDDESPLFGGKDRFSSSHSEFVPWTQYQSGIPKGATNPTITSIGPTVTPNYFPSEDEKLQYPAMAVTGLKATTTLQPFQSAVNRATSRLSAASMSIYPASPREDIGVALEGSYESEIRPILPRSKSALRNRHSTMTLAGNGNRETRYSQGLAYNGVAISSPTLLSTAQSLPKIAILPPSSSGGRARVKSSYYAPGAYPRVSNMENEVAPRLDQAYPFDSVQDNLHNMAKSVMRRDRDTQALASALGFSSPIPPSPQPTLYPDDSLSMVESYAPNKRSSVKVQPRVPVPRHRLDTPPVDTSATLGSLMLVDFGSGLPSVKDVKGFAEDVAAQVTANHRRTSNSHVKRTNDKPPRVPSPPPLPSLSQMGLQHANPEAYADYHSPTYSIYGLYNETDRKSKTTSFGY